MENTTSAQPPTPPPALPIESIMQQIGQDITNAEIGRFFALRAGIGLIITRERIPHGDWAATMAALLPNRADRTIRRYIQDARDFLGDRALYAAEVWPHIADVAPARIAAAQQQQQRLLAAGGSAAEGQPATSLAQIEPDLPREVIMMLEHLYAQEPEQPVASGKKHLTGAERRELAVTTWDSLGTRLIREAQTRRSWLLLDIAQQEQLASTLADIAADIQAAIRKSRAKTNAR